MTIFYHAGSDDASADALSRSSYITPPSQGIAQGKVQVAAVIIDEDLASLVQADTICRTQCQTDYSLEHLKDPNLSGIPKVPEDSDQAKKLVAQEFQFSLIDGTLFYILHRPQI